MAGPVQAPTTERGRPDLPSTRSGDAAATAHRAASGRERRVDGSGPAREPAALGGRRLGRVSGWPLVIGLTMLGLAVFVMVASLGLGSPAGQRIAALTIAVALCVVGVLVELLARSARAKDELVRELGRVRDRALVDGLTGLASRPAITTDIDRRLAARDPSDLVGVLFCDLDRLGVVNDSLGHAAGDEVLAVIAKRLAEAIRQTDSIGRFGGDEFVIVTAGLPAIRDVEIMAARLSEVLREPTVLADGTTQVVSGSIGIALVTGNGPFSSGGLLRDAAVATEQAKRDGGDRHVVFDHSHRAEAVDRLVIEQELRVGLECGEIIVHYQPIVGTESGLVDRVEALIRWDHPSRGTILPSEFLPVAAQSSLVVELGHLVLREACGRAVEWSASAGRPVAVAVNVGERQLLDGGLVDMVTRVLAETGLPANQLELEMPEELLLDRRDRSFLVLRQLDLLGVRIAIDDFGTSQAALGRLRQMAMVSTLKIDRLFVDGIVTDAVDRKIVAAIVALASTVGISVVAEGVETPDQARVLTDLGVEYLQGFLFRRPSKADDIEAILDVGQRQW